MVAFDEVVVAVKGVVVVPYHIVNDCPQCVTASPERKDSVVRSENEGLQHPPVNLGVSDWLFVPQNERYALLSLSTLFFG